MIKLQNKADCCGCTACSSSCSHKAIELVEDEEGFLYPSITQDKCIECGLCEQVCPIINYSKTIVQKESFNIYAVKNRNAEILRKSSSGGAFTGIANYVLLRRGVVYGASYSKDMQVVHSRIEDSTQLDILRGAKYVQSILADTYNNIKKDLLDNRYVLFVGTPCQVEGLNKYLKNPYPNLLTVDLICHNVASPKLFRDYINLIKKRFKSQITNIAFRDKTAGWGKLSPRIDTVDSKSVVGSPEAFLWLTFYFSEMAARPSCYSCKFCNYNRPGDLTIGDYWGIEKYHPEFMDKRGVSILFANTDKGNLVFGSIKNNFEVLELDKTESFQPNLGYPIERPEGRDMFWKNYSRYPFSIFCDKYYGYGMVSRIKNKIKRIIK